jgi:hypothetical protein
MLSESNSMAHVSNGFSKRNWVKTPMPGPISSTRLQPDAFRLQFTLANAASMPVALPALELTLTDSQDQAVIRRVLQPTELGPDAPAALLAAGEWASSLTLTVAPAAAGAITGYRLLAFYP